MVLIGIRPQTGTAIVGVRVVTRLLVITVSTIKVTVVGIMPKTNIKIITIGVHHVIKINPTKATMTNTSRHRADGVETVLVTDTVNDHITRHRHLTIVKAGLTREMDLIRRDEVEVAGSESLLVTN